MNVTQRGTLSPEDVRTLLEAKANEDVREQAVAAARLASPYRRVIVEMVEKSSYREVARITGLSTNTLQRWMRWAAK